MDFNSDRVLTEFDGIGPHAELKETRFVGVPCHRAGRRGCVHRSFRHVGAANFYAVEIDDRAVVTEQAQRRGIEERRLRDYKSVAKVSCHWPGDTAGDWSCFVTVAVTELGVAELPAGIVEARLVPVTERRCCFIVVA